MNKMRINILQSALEMTSVIVRRCRSGLKIIIIIIIQIGLVIIIIIISHTLPETYSQIALVP